jgi:type VI secretion system protein ImpA
MAVPAVLDFDRLLTPLNGDHLAVPWEQGWHELRALRNQAANEEKLLADGDPEQPRDTSVRDKFWREIRESAESALEKRTKDLSVVAYLIEALVRTDGFAGLRDGFHLATRLVAQRGDGLVLPNAAAGAASVDDGAAADDAAPPAGVSPDELKQRAARLRREAVERELGALAGLNGRRGDGPLVLQIKKLPLTNAGPEQEFAQIDYQDARERIKSTSEASRDKGQAMLQVLNRAAEQSSDEYLLNLRDTIAECCQEFEALTELLSARSGLKAADFTMVFATSNIKSALAECLDIAKENAKGRDAPTDESAGVPTALGSGGARQGAAGEVAAREDAFLTLEKIARFFERTDPQSPLAPAIRQIVRWGRAPLAELYAELIPDQSSREAMFKLIGLSPPEEKR